MYKEKLKQQIEKDIQGVVVVNINDNLNTKQDQFRVNLVYRYKKVLYAFWMPYKTKVYETFGDDYLVSNFVNNLIKEIRKKG